MSAHVALVTCRALADLEEDDRRLIAPLAALGVTGVPATWDDRGVEWESFDAVVLRSTWDYHARIAAFLDWIDGVEARGCRLWNPPAVIRWNSDKRYLHLLQAAGVATIPTVWGRAGSQIDLPGLLSERVWEEVVVKPAVSGGGVRTERVTAHEAKTFLATYDLMIQPYMAEIETEGEWSLMYVDGAFSHAVRKRPQPGEFRIQPQYGGRISRADPPPHVCAAADAALRCAPGPWLYARVDGLDVGGILQVMELELIEPRMFLGHDVGAAERFAAAIAARVS